MARLIGGPSCGFVEDETFGPYRLEALLGRGGMGEVYRAFDTRKARTVALKRLSRHLAADDEFTARFRPGPATAARLRDPHAIPADGPPTSSR